MATKQTPQGLVVGMIPEKEENQKPEDKAPARGGRKPKEKE